jgi:spore germination protein KC
MFDMVRDMRGQTSKALWFEHIQVIVISEEAVRRANLSKLLDFFLRDGEMRWRTRVYITPGKAQELMEFKPPTGEPGGIYLAGMARQGAKNPHIAEARTDIGFTNATINENGDVILPRIELVKDKVKINGAAMFKKNRFIGYIDEYTVKGLKFIRGTEKSALVPFECPVHPGEFALFELFRHHTKLTPHVDGESIWFTLDIAMRGNLGEVSCGMEHDTRDPVYLEKARMAFAKAVERNIAHTKQVCQTMGVDVLGFARYLKAYKPETWERVKENWQDVFPAIPLYTSVNVTILHVGEHK